MQNRRQFATYSVAATAVAASGSVALSTPAIQSPGSKSPGRGNPIAVSTYSFWRFKDDSKVPVEQCIDEAARMGFDAVELLLMQMDNQEPAYLQKLKQRALVNGVSLCGFSTHQGFVSPDAAVRQKNVGLTIQQIELAYQLGIPTMRINTGRWGPRRTSTN
jgi:sugar phosphate isomerase/epimerase